MAPSSQEEEIKMLKRALRAEHFEAECKRLNEQCLALLLEKEGWEKENERLKEERDESKADLSEILGKLVLIAGELPDLVTHELQTDCDLSDFSHESEISPYAQVPLGAPKQQKRSVDPDHLATKRRRTLRANPTSSQKEGEEYFSMEEDEEGTPPRLRVLTLQESRLPV
ncbi:hypothetical protein L202_01949 [Cryptococcus amylolentus CBS 6039]|uniref:Uncharacterized protein n=2 Tax=Cryptococcus amylolentus TaxID=104669 RepID=A0A1E3HYZ2_9TREE|nr:hypothetical protein L202_01949 [Cryptococcus amylolentus CBS 6039]ODN81529.1 hypothetical protein L202_01949 [Cryptococcus amylolentus CBS 6039]ODO10240.1 hypothetical protein I350_02469 [Cryptococcus amylolentus CBS 6273]